MTQVRVFFTRDERRLIEASDTVLNDPNSTLTDLERADRNKRRQIRLAEARAEGRKPTPDELDADNPEFRLTKRRHDEIHAHFMSLQTAYDAGKPLPERIDATKEELQAYWQDAVELEEATKAGPDAVANWERKINAAEAAGTLYAPEETL